MPDLTPLIYIGMIAIAAVVLVALVGIPLGLWWLFNHVQFI